MRGIGDTRKVIGILVGDTQRIEVYAEQGCANRMKVRATPRQACGGRLYAGDSKAFRQLRYPTSLQHVWDEFRNQLLRNKLQDGREDPWGSDQ
jgi:hypothetical protein